MIKFFCLFFFEFNFFFISFFYFISSFYFWVLIFSHVNEKIKFTGMSSVDLWVTIKFFCSILCSACLRLFYLTLFSNFQTCLFIFLIARENLLFFCKNKGSRSQKLVNLFFLSFKLQSPRFFYFAYYWNVSTQIHLIHMCCGFAECLISRCELFSRYFRCWRSSVRIENDWDPREREPITLAEWIALLYIRPLITG